MPGTRTGRSSAAEESSSPEEQHKPAADPAAAPYPLAADADPATAAFYCPGCGLRYETAGVCTGIESSPHEPISVEPLPDASSASSSDDEES